MPPENGSPWYKNPQFIGAIIVAIITAISAIIVAYIGIMPSFIDGPELATVQGVVTDNDGKPVKGALVEINGSSVTTGSDGGYVIHGVPINMKTITVRVAGAEVVKRALRISKDTEIISCDITLPLSDTPLITPYPSDDELKQFATVQGIVTDNNGKPVIGALVEIDGLSDRTCSDGRYVIHGVPINTKTITVRAHGVEVVKYVLRISKDTDILSYDITLPPGAPTPAPSVAPTPEAQITPTPETLPTPVKTVTPTPVKTVTPTPVKTVTPTPVKMVTPTPVKMVTPTPVKMVTPTPVKTVTPTPVKMVTPTPVKTVTPTPVKTVTPEPEVTIKIAEPEDGATVYDDPVIVYGTVKNFTNDVLSLWACVKSYDGIWYPQETLNRIGGETWEADTSAPQDIDTQFGIVVLVATNEADEELRKPLRGEGDSADGLGLKELPEGAIILDQITVIRGT